MCTYVAVLFFLQKSINYSVSFIIIIIMTRNVNYCKKHDILYSHVIHIVEYKNDRSSSINMCCIKYIKSFITKVQQYIIHNFQIDHFHSILHYCYSRKINPMQRT